MYPTHLVPPFAGVTPRRGEGPRSQGAGPQAGAPPKPAPGRRLRAGAGCSHPVAGLPCQPGAHPRMHLGGEG